MRVFPEIPKWILVYSPDRAKLSDDFLPFFKTAKTRMRMNKMLHALRNIVASQKSVCDKFGVDFFPPKDCDKIGIAIETIGKMPINGMRIDSENGTCGWYIWCGEELSEAPDFYKPLHVSHINKYLPEIEKYLALPSGYRFLVAGDYEDVWQDPLLNSM